MFVMHAEKNRLTVRQREPVTSGSVNVYEVRFEFSPDWDGMERVAVFKAGKESCSILLDESGECTVPWEVMGKPGILLTAGVYGTRGGVTVLPTVWASLGMILEGVTTGQDARPPTPDLWQQELAGKGDALSYDGLNLSLMAGGKPLSTVQIVSGDGGGGAGDHRALSNRDAEGQHPVKSITGLANELKKIPAPVEPLTNSELEALLQ